MQCVSPFHTAARSGCLQPSGGADVQKDRSPSWPGAFSSQFHTWLRVILTYHSPKFVICLPVVALARRFSAPSRLITPSMPETHWPRPSMDRRSPGWWTRSTSPWRIRWGEEGGKPAGFVRLLRICTYLRSILSLGPLKEDCHWPFGHIWFWGFLCEQVERFLFSCQWLFSKKLKMPSLGMSRVSV